jgi:iron(III) transport system permease protein
MDMRNLKIRTDFLSISIIAILATVLVIFVLLPVLKVFTYPSFEEYTRIIAKARTIRAVKNSLFITCLSSITATLIGFLFAYAMNYTKIPGKRLFDGLILLPLLSPPFVVALAWVLLFGGHGLITRQLLGIRGSIFGWHGLWIVQSIAFFPYSYLIIDGVLKGIDPNLEYAAKNAGANGSHVFRTVTLPLALPGVLNALVLIAIYVLADFGNPILIAGGWPVLPTEIYGRISGHYDLSGAAALSSLLLLPTLLLFILNRTLLRGKSFITVTGRGEGLERPMAGPFTQWCLFAFCALLTSVVVLVYGTLLAGAFVKIWGINWTPSLENFQVLKGVRGESLLNSLFFACFAGLGAAIFSIFASYFIYKKTFSGKRVLDFLSLLPAAIPGVFLGVGFLLSFNSPPLVLSGTAAIIILALMVWNIPLGYQACTAGLEQIGAEIEEAAMNLGANPIRVFKDTIFPLLRSPFLSGFIMGFLRAITNLSIVIFLISPGKSVATVEILDLIQYAELGPAVALTVVLFTIALAVVGIARLLLRWSFGELKGLKR